MFFYSHRILSSAFVCLLYCKIKTGAIGWKPSEINSQFFPRRSWKSLSSFGEKEGQSIRRFHGRWNRFAADFRLVLSWRSAIQRGEPMSLTGNFATAFLLVHLSSSTFCFVVLPARDSIPLIWFMSHLGPFYFLIYEQAIAIKKINQNYRMLLKWKFWFYFIDGIWLFSCAVQIISYGQNPSNFAAQID